MGNRKLSEISSNNLVAQANALIKSRYKATRNEEILLKSMMSLIDPRDKEFMTFTATTKELADILQLHPATAVREFDKITTRLLSRVLKIEKDEENWIKFQWVSEASLENGIVSLKFHDKLKPYLLALRETGHFTQYRLEDVLWFRSAYTSRIYEMLIEANNKKQRFVKTSLIDFRYRMMGDKSTSYPLFKNFRKYVINVAQKELSQLDENGFHRSKLNFDLITHRTARKITDLEFRIIKQEKGKKPIDINKNEEEPETDVEKMLLSYGVTKKNISKFLKEKTEEYILEKEAHMKRSHKKSPVRDFGVWLTGAIEGDWKDSEITHSEADKKKSADNRKELEAEYRKKQQENAKKEAEEQVKKEFLENITEEEGIDLLAEMKADPQNGNFVKGIDFGMGRSMLYLYIPDFEAKVSALIEKN